MLLAIAVMAALAVRSPAAEPAKPAAPAQAAATPAEKTAEQAYKNIKVLTGMPASQLMPVMHLMRASLGVRCDFCHVAEGNRYELDTKEEKETAREMIRMVFAINKQNFDGRTTVTCNTCHRGAEHPVRTPPIGQGQFDDTTHSPGESEGAERAKLPSATEVLDRYIQALGGRAALEGVKSRVTRGTLLHMDVVGAGTPKAKAVNRGAEEPFEIVATPTDLRKELTLRDRAADPANRARVGRETLDGKDMILVRMPGEEGTSLNLYFDPATGLLRRQIVNRPTVLGLDPEQTDYDDYRDVGAVKVPFLVKTSYLDDNHLGTTRKVAEVQDNKR
jgi:hypothetical protein